MSPLGLTLRLLLTRWRSARSCSCASSRCARACCSGCSNPSPNPSPNPNPNPKPNPSPNQVLQRLLRLLLPSTIHPVHAAVVCWLLAPLMLGMRPEVMSGTVSTP